MAPCIDAPERLASLALRWPQSANITPQPYPLNIFLPCTTSAMTSIETALLESLSSEMKHEVVALAAAWQRHHARWIEAGRPAIPSEISDDDPMMDTGPDDDSTSETPMVHAALTMEQA
ncbi:NHL repeat-containing protein 2 [Hordeum vulgare]|nr:NHL repeat-containing protein 2 [Hordeum vulgare]